MIPHDQLNTSFARTELQADLNEKIHLCEPRITMHGA